MTNAREGVELKGKKATSATSAIVGQVNDVAAISKSLERAVSVDEPE